MAYVFICGEGCCNDQNRNENTYYYIEKVLVVLLGKYIALAS